MTDWTKEEEEAFNEVEKHSNLGKQILRGIEGQPYHFEKREWVGLTDEEIQTEWVLTPQNDKAEGIWFGRRIEAKLKEKNT